MFGFLVIIQIVQKIPDILDQFLMDSFGDELAWRSDTCSIISIYLSLLFLLTLCKIWKPIWSFLSADGWQETCM